MGELVRGSRSRLVVVLCVVLAALGLSTSGPAGADQADSAVGRVAAASITAGAEHTCALLTTGAVRCWGNGLYGQLGYGSPDSIGDDPARPMAGARDVPLGGKATAITAGYKHTCALLTTGDVRCWGDGEFGQLGYGNHDNVGDGTGPSIKEAGDVPLDGKATAIAAGDSHTCALLTAGAVRCWGYGGDGELGHDSRDNVGDGVGPSIKDAGDVPLGGKATAIAAGGSHTCALLRDGEVRCWGDGSYGQLGHDHPDNVGDGGSDLSIKLAGKVPVGGSATAITAGDSHTCALLTTGAVRCWGYGGDGALGHDSPDNVGDGGSDLSIKLAGKVPVGGSATAVTTGAYHTCALLSRAALRCWGLGSHGQLGHDSRVRIGGGGVDSSIDGAGDVLLDARVRVRASAHLSATIRPTRDRHAPYVYRVTGHLRGRFAADPATCTGQVKVSIRHGRRLLQAHTTRLHADCHYRVRTRLTARRLHTHRSTRLTIEIHYLGTHNLEPTATSRHVRAN